MDALARGAMTSPEDLLKRATECELLMNREADDIVRASTTIPSYPQVKCAEKEKSPKAGLSGWEELIVSRDARRGGSTPLSPSPLANSV
jgi:hypothetical protein